MVQATWQQPKYQGYGQPQPMLDNIKFVTKREMDPIKENESDSTASTSSSSHSSSSRSLNSPSSTPTSPLTEFRINAQGAVCNRQTKQQMTKAEIQKYGEQILKKLTEYVHHQMLHDLRFEEQAIPSVEDGSLEDDDDPSRDADHMMISSVVSTSICSTVDGFRMMMHSDIPRCIFHTSQDYRVARKLLVFVCSSRGLSCGIWSRSVLLSDGMQVGSMIPYFKAAMRSGYGIIVMNPNMNSQMIMNAEGTMEKMPIVGSSTGEEHVEHVWKHYIFPSAAQKIHFIAYGYGGVLVAQMLDKYKYELKTRLGNIAFLESSHKLDPTWNLGFKKFFSHHSLCWKRSKEPLNADLTALYGTEGRGVQNGLVSSLGCRCLSAGPLKQRSDSPAYTTQAVLTSVFKFLDCSGASDFLQYIARKQELRALRKRCGNLNEIRTVTPSLKKQESVDPNLSGDSSNDGSCESVNIDDFDLLKVVGRGGFGKVVLVRKKLKKENGVLTPNGKVYAMKVIKKSAVVAKHQIEHTKTERRIMLSIDHPFIVKLRFAFQNESKLYFVMDYYNGGTLHFHLHYARYFEESCARFYGAQMVLAISHLHTYNIVYRDLKPENVLLDEQGFIALTDFGLSRDKVDDKEGMGTFCGTPEYIAPELIRRIPYGKSVDYWSLGVVLYELMAGFTPFYHVSRRRNFENIVRAPLRFPVEFSENAKSLLTGLICRDPSKRLGSGSSGVKEIMDHPFFAEVDWKKLYQRKVPVPFQPNVKKDGDLHYIPEFFKRQEVMDSVPLEPTPISAQEFKDFSYVDPFQM